MVVIKNSIQGIEKGNTVLPNSLGCLLTGNVARYVVKIQLT